MFLTIFIIYINNVNVIRFNGNYRILFRNKPS